MNKIINQDKTNDSQLNKSCIEKYNYEEKSDENHRKVSHRPNCNIGAPSRPFKKARFAWEIKNYEHTINKMNQENVQPECRAECIENQNLNFINIKNQDFCAQNASCNNFVIPQGFKFDKQPNSIIPFNYQEYNRSTHSQLGQVAKDNDTEVHPPPDPDARLIRWHTNQLCRSIFDNTVNRMLENMGFSPLTEQQSHNLHPLLVLNLSDDEERENEEVRQRVLESQALSAALHQKSLIAHPYHYEPLESATTSDYDSSEDESELGDGGCQEEDFPCEHIQSLQNNPYFNLQHASSLAHLVSRPMTCMQMHSQLPSDNCQPILNSIHCPSPHISYNNHNESYLTNCILNKNNSENGHIEECHVNYSTRCQSLECRNEENESGEVDDNENCIPKQTLIEGKVEGVLEENDSNIKNTTNDMENKYFIRNAIEIAIKQ